jgi:ABC-type transporter Mla MlaB component
MSVLEKCTVELDGVFDRPAALKIAEALAWVRPGGAVDVDLTHVREFHDVGLAVLARTLVGQRDSVHIELRGLRDRQVRMLRYLGIEMDGSALLGSAATAAVN